MLFMHFVINIVGQKGMCGYYNFLRYFWPTSGYVTIKFYSSNETLNERKGFDIVITPTHTGDSSDTYYL